MFRMLPKPSGQRGRSIASILYLGDHHHDYGDAEC